MWDVASGNASHVIRANAAFTSGIAFSPDDQWMVSSSHDGTVKLWDLHHDGAMTRIVGDDLSGCWQFHRSEAILASTANDNTIRIWNIESGTELNRLDGQEAKVTSIAYSPDGSLLASSTEDNIVRIWDAISGETIRDLKSPHSKQPSHYWGRSEHELKFSSDGDRIALFDCFKLRGLWDVESGKSLGDIPELDSNSLASSPTSSLLAFPKIGSAITVWDAESSTERLALIGHTDSVRCLTFSPDGLKLLSGSLDKTIRLWDVATGTEIRRFLGHKTSVRCVSFSNDGRRFVSLSEDNCVRVWELNTGQLIFDFAPGYASDIQRVCFAAGDSHVLGRESRGEPLLWNLEAGEQYPVETYCRIGFSPLSPDGEFLVGGSYAGAVVFDVRSGLERIALSTHESIICAAYSRDGSKVVSGSENNTIRLWSALTGDEILRPIECRDQVALVEFSADGTRVLSVSSTVQIWNASSGQLLETYEGKYDYSSGFAMFVDNDRRVAILSKSGEINLWEPGRSDIRLPLHHYEVAPTYSERELFQFYATLSMDETAIQSSEDTRRIAWFPGKHKLRHAAKPFDNLWVAFSGEHLYVLRFEEI
jgi:WD40 repeat protein